MLEQLAIRFPQLYIAPEIGASKSERYINVVRRGETLENGSLDGHFIGSKEDRLDIMDTPAGPCEVVFLKNRADFECFYRIMAYRCEPAAIAPTTGAACISGIIDWRKIDAHRKNYEAAGNTDWDQEFKRFTANQANYRITLLVVSDGSYSAIPYEKTPYHKDEWNRLSLVIRTYHEITHFICRKLYPDEKNAVWDELLADLTGLLFATDSYDAELAKTFLGVNERGYNGGRLENYIPQGADMKDYAKRVSNAVDQLKLLSDQYRAQGIEGFDHMLALQRHAKEWIQTWIL